MTITFLPPSRTHDDPQMVAARFFQDGDQDRPSGIIYTDGSCSCGENEATGTCRHTQDYGQQFYNVHDFNEYGMIYRIGYGVVGFIANLAHLGSQHRACLDAAGIKYRKGAAK